MLHASAKITLEPEKITSEYIQELAKKFKYITSGRG